MLETGLGGRLDATRTVPADIAVITSLSLEHTEILGATLDAIAGEKAAIARPGKPMIVRAVNHKAARQRVGEVAQTAGHPVVEDAIGPADLHWVEIPDGATYFDEANLLAAAVWGHLVCAENTPYAKVRALQWPGRMHELHSERSGNTWLLEGAHNPSGMEVSCSELMDDPRWKDPWTLLLGSTPQEDMDAMLAPLVDLCKQHPPAAIVLTEPQFGRYPGVPCEALEEALRSQGIQVTASFPEPAEAVAWIESQEGGGEGPRHVLCIGSLYLQGNVLTALGADDDQTLAIVAKE